MCLDIRLLCLDVRICVWILGYYVLDIKILCSDNVFGY